MQVRQNSQDRDIRSVRREYVDGPFGQIHVRRAGTPGEGKRPVVCFHLTPGSGRMYEELLAELGRDRFALAPDTPGYGASDPPPQVPTIPDYARAMTALLDHYGIDSVDLLGYHTGSKIAVELAVTQPQRVHAIALVSAPVYTEEELARQARTLATPRRIDESGQHLVDQFRELLHWRPPGTPLELIQREFAEQLRAGERAHWGYLAAFSYQHAEYLPRVQQEVLLLCPEDDLEVPTLRAEPLINRGRFVRLPGWGYQMMITRTAEVAALLREHFDR